MLHRLSAFLIVGFWLAMTGLLVMRELYPESTRLNDVPVSHVGRLVFQHQQPSDLVVHDKVRETGFFHLQPRVDGRERILEMHGNMGVATLLGGRQRISWACNLTLDVAWHVRGVKLTLSTHEPQQQLDFEVEPGAAQARFKISVAGAVMEQGEFELSQKGVATLLARSGLPVALLEQMASSAQKKVGEPEVDARHSSMTMNGERVQTYLVTVKLGGETALEAHVTPLGQVMRASVPLLGYKLAPHNVAP